MLKHQKFYWHLELSSKCSLACPRCPRTEKPGKYVVTELDLDFVQKVFTKDVIDQSTKILMCGGQGDPIYCKEMLEICEYFKIQKPELCLSIVTNGSYKTTEWWAKLANILNEHDHVTFSVDGWDQDSNNQYRVNSNFDSITNGISTLRYYNEDVYITWSTIVFSFNEDKLNQIQELAHSYEVDNFNIVQSSLFGSHVPSYIDKDLGYDPLQPSKGYESKFSHSEREKRLGFTKRVPPDSVWHEKMASQIFTMTDYDNAPVYPLCLAGDRGLYIDAEGTLYPCSWISHPFGQRTSKSGKKILWNDSLFVKHKKEFSLRDKTLDEVIESEYWNDIVDGWKDSNKTYVECENKCNLRTGLIKLHKRLDRKIEIV